MQESIKALYAMAGAISIATFILLAISFSTPNWIECIAIRDDDLTDEVCQREDLTNPQAPQDKYTGLVEFGVIYGYKQFNYGYGMRERETFIVFDENEGQYNTVLVIVALAFMIPALIFSVPSSVLGFVNCKMVPIETINGRAGLYAWNIIGFVSSATSMSVYIALYLQDIKVDNNALSKEDTDHEFCVHSVFFGYSFWLLVTAVCLFFVNIVIVVLTQLIQDTPGCLKNHRQPTYEEPNTTVELREGIMY